MQAGSSALSLLLQAAHFAFLARSFDRGTFSAVVTALAMYSIAGALGEFGLQQTAVLRLSDGAGERDVIVATRRASLVLASGALLVAALVVAMMPTRVATSALALVPAFVLVRLQVPHVALRQHRLDFVRLAIGDLAGRAMATAIVVPFGLRWVDLPEPFGTVVVGVSLAAGAMVTLLVRRTTPRPIGSESPVRWQRLVGEAMPLGLTNAASFVHVRIDQVLLALIGFSPEIAAYAVAYRVLDASVAVVSALGAFALAVLARERGEGRTSAAREIGDLLATVGAVAGVAAFLAAPDLAALLGGGEYPEAADLIRLMVPVLVVSVLNVGPAQVVIAGSGSRRLLVLALVAVGANIGLNVVLIPMFGLEGAILATMITETGGLLGVAVLARSVLPGSVSIVQLCAVAAFSALTAMVARTIETGAVRLAVLCAGFVVVFPSTLRLLRQLRSAAPEPMSNTER